MLLLLLLRFLLLLLVLLVWFGTGCVCLGLALEQVNLQPEVSIFGFNFVQAGGQVGDEVDA